MVCMIHKHCSPCFVFAIILKLRSAYLLLRNQFSRSFVTYVSGTQSHIFVAMESLCGFHRSCNIVSHYQFIACDVITGD